MAGTAGIQIPILVDYLVTGAISGGVDNFTVTRAGRAIDYWVVKTADPGGAATLQIGNGANAISAAVDIAAGGATAVARAAVMNAANYTFAVGDSLRYTAAGANAADIRGHVCVLFLTALTASTVV